MNKPLHEIMKKIRDERFEQNYNVTPPKIKETYVWLVGYTREHNEPYIFEVFANETLAMKSYVNLKDSNYIYEVKTPVKCLVRSY